MMASGAASLTGAPLSGTFSVFSDRIFSTGAILGFIFTFLNFFIFWLENNFLK